ncbi:hypothetical protein NM688_g98 [Phlebia brevispora]|uniref:Uncharacterized protein n=1 Tax=Phlebia brevispora TaxID=194682 RepID=A0ACC1TF20_9APHY|nr:hypothetical protein NM688_g98 [Phlebia brevispora]
MAAYHPIPRDVVIVAATRTPVGSINGALKSLTAPELGIIALKHAFKQCNLDPAVVEEIFFGNVVQAGVGQSPARQVALGAGMSSSSDATTINKVCASGLKAIMLAAQSISSGYKSVVAAGGTESMSNAPFLLPRQNPVFGKFDVKDALQTDGLWDVYNQFAMGNCGEYAAAKHGISREAQDAHAIESYRRAERAWRSGAFDAEIAPVTVHTKKGDVIVREDEEYKRVIYEKIPTLKPAFKPDGGSITAANSSNLNDGASAVILMSADRARVLGLKPLAKIISYADVGVDPIDFPSAPAQAIPMALENAGLSIDDISLFEVNEAYSVVVRIVEKVLGIDPAKINVNGGAVALGHAIGNSGSRIIVTLIHALQSGQYGAAGICNGGGLNYPTRQILSMSTTRYRMLLSAVGCTYFGSRFSLFISTHDFMASIERRSVASSEKAPASREDEKHDLEVNEIDAASAIDSYEGDEALKLVGRERTVEFSDEYNKKLRRKLDLVIPPLCAAVYFTQFLDKTSLNYASIMGLPITGQHYNLVSLAFYLGFLVWEFPTVYISQKLRIGKYLGANVVVWGIILMLHATTSSFGGFFALRFLLGMCECCVAPILILVISMFYKKDEQNGLTQVFGGFVAYGISFDNGKQIAPYKIIYLLLGALAIIVGVCVLIWLPDSPVHARILTKEERIAALERVRDDQGGTENKRWKKEQIIEAVTDIRTWLIVLSTLLTSIPNGALSNFSNIIIRNFGYTSRQTLILSTPGGAVASVTTLLCGWYSDKKGERMLPIIFCIIPTIVGSGMLVGLNASGDKGALLFATYIIGTFGSALSSIYAYNASNTSGHTKKNTINAMTLVSFGLGNIIGTEIFQPKDAPAYIPGKIAILVLLSVQLGVSFLLRWINIRLNTQRRTKLEEEKARRGWTDADVQKERERHAFLDLTDKQNLFFIYTA